LIKDLEIRLQEAKDLKAKLTARIASSQTAINDNNTKIVSIRTTIDQINVKIRTFKDSRDALSKSAFALEVDVQRARTDLSIAQAREKTFFDQIRDFQVQIAAQQRRLVNDDLSKLRVIINNLKNFIPQIQNQINSEYYNCYGAGRVETITTGSFFVYVIKRESFVQYIQNAYGQSVSFPSLITSGDYRLQIVDPFSRIWTSKFGYPFTADTKGAASFSCLNGGNFSQLGWGKISSVTNDGFIVNDANGKGVKLTVGTCSKIEATSELPRVGQTLAWRGSASGNSGYYLQSATCW